MCFEMSLDGNESTSDTRQMNAEIVNELFRAAFVAIVGIWVLSQVVTVLY